VLVAEVNCSTAGAVSIGTSGMEKLSRIVPGCPALAAINRVVKPIVSETIPNANSTELKR
jgi:hypothetical protein